MSATVATERDAAIVYRAARIRTMDAAWTVATGLLVRGERIAAVGGADALLAAAGSGAQTVDLGAATVVPGFIDAHCHSSMLAYLLTGADCSFEAAPTVEAIVARLAATPPGQDGWVTGSWYAEYKLIDGRHPTREELDAATGDVPCALYHLSLHLCIVNSAGLRALKLADNSLDPEQSWLGCDAEGRLDGRLYEALALDLLGANMRQLLDGLDGAGRAAFVRRAGDHLASLGITSTSDAASDAGAFMAFREAEHRGELPVRMNVMFTYPEADWLLRARMTTGFGSDRLRIGAIKLFCDGGLSSRTAALDEPYSVPPHESGLLRYEADALAADIRTCDEAGFQVAVHAQGERGIRTTLAAYAAVIARGNPLRHRIEHGACFTPEHRAEAARLGIVVVSQPGFFSGLGDGYLEALGPERAARIYPYASLRDAGVLVAGASDAPVIGAAPLVAMRDAILRRTDGGAVLGPDEAITAAEGLALYTRNAAFASHHEADVGSLEPGMLADFTVLDRDPLATPAEAIAEIAVLRTIVGGAVTFERAPEAVHA